MTAMRGTREQDGEQCSAIYIGRFEEDLFDIDLYGVLNVTDTASSGEIRRAFRRLRFNI